MQQVPGYRGIFLDQVFCRSHRREASGGDVQPAKPLEVRAFVGGDPQRAVRGEFGAAIGNVARMVADGVTVTAEDA